MAAISQRKVKDGLVYEIRVSRGRDPVTGKQLTPYTMRYTPPEGYSVKRALKEAQVIAAQFEADCRAGKVLTKAERKAKAEQAQREAAAHPTFKAYGESWLKATATSGEKAPNTINNYRIMLERVTPVLGKYKMQDITKPIIQSYITQLYTNGRNETTGEPLAWSTKDKIFTLLKTFFSEAADAEIIAASPMERVKRPKRPKGETVQDEPDKAFSADEVKYILECSKNEPLKYQAMIAFMIDTGCRIGEAVAFRWEDIDFENQIITICRNAQYTTGKGVYITSPKNGKPRSFPVLPQTLTIMKAWKREQALFCLAQGISNSGYCFTGDTGDMMHPRTVESFFTRFGKRYNIPGFHPHALRHTMISLSITNGADVVSVSKKAGHSSTSITLNVYSHATEEAQRKANELLAAQIYKKA